MKKRTQTLFTMATLAAVLTGCETTHTNHKSNVVTIATQASHPPFAYIDKNKEIVGFDITLINDLCVYMQVECEIVHDDRSSLLPNLQQGKYDAVIAAVSMNDDSSQQLDFTNSYYQDNFALVVNNNAKVDISTMKDAKIAVLYGTEAQTRAEAQYPDARVVGFKTQSSAFLALSELSKDAVYADETAIKEWLTSHGSEDLYKVVTEEQGTKSYGIAVQKDSTLKTKLNKALAEYKATGEYEKLYNTYFAKSG